MWLKVKSRFVYKKRQQDKQDKQDELDFKQDRPDNKHVVKPAAF